MYLWVIRKYINRIVYFDIVVFLKLFINYWYIFEKKEEIVFKYVIVLGLGIVRNDIIVR